MGNNQVKEEIIVKCEIGEMLKQFFKDSVIIWHDPNIDSPQNKPFIAQLENLCQVKTFTQFEESLTYIKETKETCHIITSETNVEEICEAKNIYGIYILGGQIQKSNPKVLCVESNLHHLLFKVEQNLIQNYKASSHFSFAPIFTETDKKQLKTLHMYLNIIPTFKNHSQAKTDFLTLCKVLFSDEKDFDFIINLAQNYEKQNVLNWFTQRSLFPTVLNTCLRISSSDSLQYCRLPLHDMQKAIHEQYQKKSKNFSGLLYRAVDLSEEEWTNLKENCNKEIETLGFFWASKDLPIALNKKVLITILIPKGPNEQQYGFAEIEQNQVIFNTMSRFTILEANEQYSQDLPCRHLVLLFGARGFRMHLTEKDPVVKISLDTKVQILCDFCKINVLQKSQKFFFKSLTNQQNHYCQECIHNIPLINSIPFLCVPVSNRREKMTVTLKGCILTYPLNLKIPFYLDKCCQENNAYFKCLECQKRWCAHCIDSTESCIQLGHSIIFERNPFSFWQERMPENEAKELLAEKENLTQENKQAEMFIKTQEYEKALAYYLKFLKILERTKSNGMQYAYWKIAEICFKKREYAKALQYYLEVYKTCQSTDPKSENTLTNIGRTYYMLGEFSQGEEYCLKALELSVLVKGENHPSQANHYAFLGEINRIQENHQKALKYLLKALELSKENPSDLKKCCIVLGHCYFGLGDYKKAEEYCIQASDIMQSTACFDLFGQIYQARGDYKKAQEFYWKALETSNEESLERANYYDALGGVYLRQGDYNKALEFHFKALEKMLSVPEENHIFLIEFYNSIAEAYCCKGDYSKALEFCGKALEISKVAHGENHPQLTSCYSVLGQIYKEKGEYNQALDYYLKDMELLQNLKRKNHPSIGSCNCDAGSVYNCLGADQKALEYYFRALQITEAAFGDNINHPNLAYCYSGLGQVFCNKKDFKAAMNYNLKSLGIRKELHGENHPNVAVCYVDIGDVYQGEGDHEKAKEYYIKALEIRRLILGDDHPHTIAVQTQMKGVKN